MQTTFIGAARPLQKDGLATAAAQAGVDPAVLWSVMLVETSGFGFLPDKRSSILFERHIFSRHAEGRFDAASGDQRFGRRIRSAGTQPIEPLEEAIGCDRRAALESDSWRLGQVMGFNAAAAGFHDAEEMVSQASPFCGGLRHGIDRGENEQILAMASFMRASGMHTSLQRRDWTTFARRYNGPDFAANRYDEKLAVAHTSISSKALPDLEARAVQLLLTYHGFRPGKIDGIVGELTRAAITALTSRHRLSATGDHEDLQAALLETLAPAAEGRVTSPANIAPHYIGA